MPAYIKLGDIKGEAEESFVFATRDTKDEGTGTDDDMIDFIETGASIALILPAVQQFADSGKEPMAASVGEDFTLSFTEIEWTY